MKPMRIAECRLRSADCGAGDSREGAQASHEKPSLRSRLRSLRLFAADSQSPSSLVPRPSSPGLRAFTMIEIAISLAVIGFALVAIIGILPTGMQTQKDNRQETIVNQDATVFLDAIRNGEHYLDDLTNYVVAITNYVTEYRIDEVRGTFTPVSSWTNAYTYNNAFTTYPPAAALPLLLTNGLHIVGLLSTPKFIPLSSGEGALDCLSNHVVAYVRSMSGNAAEKAPASYSPGINPVQDLAFELGFSYRLIPEVVPYFAYDTAGIPLALGSPAAAPGGQDTNYFKFAENLQTNLHDLRLTFRWPLLPSGDAGPGRQVYRAPAVGLLTWTNEFDPLAWWPTNAPLASLPTTLFFFQPRTYLEVQTP